MPASAPSLLDWLIALGTLGGPIVSAVAVLIAIRAQRQAQEAQFDQHRPMLIIVEEQSHLHTRDDLTTLNWAPGSQTIVVSNVGAGPALRIHGALFGADITDLQPRDQRLWLDLGKVLPPGASYEDSLSTKDGLLLRTSTMIAGHRLGIPLQDQAMDRVRLGLPPVEARLTLTYHDIYGHAYASIYDYTLVRSWEPVVVRKKIDDDLDALNRKARLALQRPAARPLLQRATRTRDPDRRSDRMPNKAS